MTESNDSSRVSCTQEGQREPGRVKETGASDGGEEKDVSAAAVRRREEANTVRMSGRHAGRGPAA